jgi:DNA-binding MarR family transcriptional regulator
MKTNDGYELGMLLRKAYLSFQRRANSRLIKHGVTADQFVLLSVLVQEEGLTQIAIVERTSSDPNTVAAILSLLERRRLIRRETHERDRRARCVFLTPEGRRVQRRGAKEAQPLLAALWSCTPGADRMQIGRFLKRVQSVFSASIADSDGDQHRRQKRILK